jgi:hypothetical protein
MSVFARDTKAQAPIKALGSRTEQVQKLTDVDQ